MSIQTVKEPVELLESPAEDCCLCDQPTRYWHEGNDVPVCPACAAVNQEEDLPTKARWCARGTK